MQAFIWSCQTSRVLQVRDFGRIDMMRAKIGQVVIHEKLIVTFKGQKKVRHRSFNTKSLPFRFEIQPQDEIEDIQVDPFSSLPPTMSSFIVPSAFTSLAFDHQPSSMPSSPAFQGVKQRPPKMGSLNREASQRQLIDSSDLFTPSYIIHDPDQFKMAASLELCIFDPML